MPKKVLLLDPPSGRILEPPYGSLPSLAGALLANGHRVVMRDLNAILFDEIFSARTAKHAFDILPKKRSKRTSHTQESMGREWLKKQGIRRLSGRIRNRLHVHLPQKRFPGRSLRLVRAGFRLLIQELSSIVQPERWDEDYFASIENPVFNYFYHLYAPYLKKIDWQEIDLVGITLSQHSEIAGLSLAMAVRKIAPRVPIVIGGPLIREIDFHNESDMAQIKKIIELGFADYLVIYEGETALLSLLNNLEHKGSMHEVHNLIWMEHGQLVINKPFYFENIQDLPLYNYRGFPVEWYPGLSVEISRGCYWAKCAFCSHCYLHTERSKFARNASAYRCVDPRKVVVSIKRMQEKYGHSHYDFACLDVSPPEMDHLCDEIIASNTDIGWAGRLRLDRTFKPALLDKMARAGVTYFHLHPETLTQSTADLHGKGYNIDHIKGLMTYWEKNRNRLPPLVVNVFTCFPGETFDAFRETFDNIAKSRFYVQNIHCFWFNKHSRIFYTPDKYGVSVRHFPNNRQLFANYQVKYEPEILHEWQRIRRFLKTNKRVLKDRMMWPNYFLSENDWKWSRVK